MLAKTTHSIDLQDGTFLRRRVPGAKRRRLARAGASPLHVVVLTPRPTRLLGLGVTIVSERIIEAARRAGFARSALRLAKGARGELALANGRCQEHPTARLVLVLGPGSAPGVVRVLLVTNETEWATDLDLVVPGRSGPAPFAFAVQAELYGEVEPSQLGGTFGSLDDVRVSAVEEALRTDGESLAGMTTGTALGGFADPRRRFKDEELTDMMRLGGRCCRGWAGTRPTTD